MTQHIRVGARKRSDENQEQVAQPSLAGGPEFSPHSGAISGLADIAELGSPAPQNRPHRRRRSGRPPPGATTSQTPISPSHPSRWAPASSAGRSVPRRRTRCSAATANSAATSSTPQTATPPVGASTSSGPGCGPRAAATRWCSRPRSGAIRSSGDSAPSESRMPSTPRCGACGPTASMCSPSTSMTVTSSSKRASAPSTR